MLKLCCLGLVVLPIWWGHRRNLNNLQITPHRHYIALAPQGPISFRHPETIPKLSSLHHIALQYGDL